MTPGSILVCRDARAAHWQLGPLPPDHGRLTLITWTRSEATPDSGVPAGIASVLARAWTEIARVTFPSSDPGVTATEAWSPSDAGLVRALTGGGILDRTRAVVRRTSVAETLISTRQPDIVSRVFGDPGFPWWLQGQVVLLSDPEAAPPDVDEARLFGLLEDDWAHRSAALAATGVQGVVRPGVDGAVVGLLALDELFDARLLESLEWEARRAGMAWSAVPESAL